MSEMKCAVSSCNNKISSGVRFFSFPTDEIRQTQWANRCQRKTPIDFSTEMVCYKHFSSSDFEDASDAQRSCTVPEILKRSAVPSLHIRESNSSINPFTTGSPFIDKNSAVNKVPSRQERVTPVEVPYEEDYSSNENVQLNSRPQLEKQLAQALKIIQQLEEKVQRLEEDVRNADTSTIETLFNGYFTSNQIDLILNRKKQVTWTEEELTKANRLRNICLKSYIYVKDELKYPLPGLTSLRRWCEKQDSWIYDHPNLSDHSYLKITNFSGRKPSMKERKRNAGKKKIDMDDTNENEDIIEPVSPNAMDIETHAAVERIMDNPPVETIMDFSAAEKIVGFPSVKRIIEYPANEVVMENKDLDAGTSSKDREKNSPKKRRVKKNPNEDNEPPVIMDYKTEVDKVTEMGLMFIRREPLPKTLIKRESTTPRKRKKTSSEGKPMKKEKESPIQSKMEVENISTVEQDIENIVINLGAPGTSTSFDNEMLLNYGFGLSESEVTETGSEEVIYSTITLSSNS